MSVAAAESDGWLEVSAATRPELDIVEYNSTIIVEAGGDVVAPVMSESNLLNNVSTGFDDGGGVEESKKYTPQNPSLAAADTSNLPSDSAAATDINQLPAQPVDTAFTVTMDATAPATDKRLLLRQR